MKLKELLRRINYVLLITTLALASSIGFIGYAAYLHWYPVKVLTIENIPFPILTPVVHPGGSVIYHVIFHKYIQVQGNISVSFVGIQLDGTGIKHGFSFTDGTPPGNYDRDISLEVPCLPEGIYHLETLGTYPVNSLQTVNVTSSTQEFKVTGICK